MAGEHLWCKMIEGRLRSELAEAKSVLRHESDCIEAAKEHIASLESTLSAMENESIEKDRLGAEMLGERNARIASLEKSVTVLRWALDRVLIGVNHIATYRTDAWPKPGTAPMEALDKLGAGKEYDMWCCWNAAMTNRDVLAQTVAGQEREGDFSALADFTHRETLLTLLELLNPIHGSLDKQTYDDKVKEGFDAPPDAEYSVNVTAQQERDLTQAVCILESRLRGGDTRLTYKALIA